MRTPAWLVAVVLFPAWIGTAERESLGDESRTTPAESSDKRQSVRSKSGQARPHPEDGSGLRAAEQHLRKGRYEEAIAAFDHARTPSTSPSSKPNSTDPNDDKKQIDKTDSLRIVLGKSKALMSLSRLAEAKKELLEGAKKHPRSAAVRGRLAELAFLQGDYDDAEKAIADALRLDDQELRARLVQADLYVNTGRLKEAFEGYRWFVRYYNRVQPTDAENLLFVAKGSLQYARWARSNQIFDFVINTLCPDALKNDPDLWEADYLGGALLLEKYNRAQGIPELQKALAKNPRAVEVLTALAEAAYEQRDLDESKDYLTRALKVAPKYVPALTFQARMLLGSGEYALAETGAKLALQENPKDAVALATLAAAVLLTDGHPDAGELTQLCEKTAELRTSPAPKSRFGKIVVQVVQTNSKPGIFFSHLGELVESRRYYDLAEQFYNTATRLMPQISSPRTALGMLYMRTGRTAEAGKIFDEAFRADPYHVRVSNMRKVVKLLDGYETLSTPHFVIRYDNKFDKILASYLAEYLEEIYPEIVKRYGFEPPSRTVFEIYNNAKGLSGHEWFSARMTGLPWIQTVGASTGVMVAFTSPSAAKEPFHWARVARHEFTHVITLQQTRFQIPHWFTEALAVTEEKSPRPAIWNRLLAERVPAGKLQSLDELNETFIRPKSPLDWQFAYCQSRLYAQFIIERHGVDKIAKMLDGYRRNLSTPRVIRETFAMESSRFDSEYRDYLKKLTAGLPARPAESKTLEQLAQAYRDRPEDVTTGAMYAEGLLKAGRGDAAKKLAQEVLQRQPKNTEATLVLANIDEKAENYGGAVRRLRPLFDRTKPDARILRSLARNLLLEGRRAEAVELFELGLKAHPDDVELMRGVAAGYLQLGETKRLREALARLASHDGNNFEMHKRIAALALADHDYPAAIQHGREALYVDVLDAENHRTLAKAYRGTKQYVREVREWEVVLELEPNDTAAEIELARSLHLAGRATDAKTRLNKLLQRKDDLGEDVAAHKREARQLLDKWK